MFPTSSSASGAPYFPNTVGSATGSAANFGDPFRTSYSPAGDPFQTRPHLQGVGSPPSSSNLAPPSAPSPTPKEGFLGDRGSLTHHWSPRSPAPLSPAPTSPIPPSELQGLSQEVAAKELELKVLRQQVEATQREADRLRSQLRDANLHLVQASGNVGTLSAKVEATAGSTSMILDASTQRIQEQISGYRRRLARMEYERAEKEEDIAALTRVIAAGREKIDGHANLVQAAAARAGQFQDEQGLAANMKQKAVSNWKDDSVARIQQEKANTALARERRVALEQHDVADDEINAIRKNIHHLEQKCKYHSAEIARRQQHLESLQMEERLCESAARLGAEQAAEHKRHSAAEAQLLQQRIVGERSKMSSKSTQAQSYEMMERSSRQTEEQLKALTWCARECARQLGGAAGATADSSDRLNQEVAAWVQRAGLPAAQRVGPAEYNIDGQVMQFAISDSGRLCVRMPEGGLLPVDDYFRVMEDRRRQEAQNPQPEQLNMAPTSYGVERGQKPLHALVSPMTISGVAPPVR